MCGLASLPAPLPSLTLLHISLLQEHKHTHRFPFPELCFENRSFILTVNSQADRYSPTVLSIIKPPRWISARYTCYCSSVSPRWSVANHHKTHTHEECRITHTCLFCHSERWRENLDPSLKFQQAKPWCKNTASQGKYRCISSKTWLSTGGITQKLNFYVVLELLYSVYSSLIQWFLNWGVNRVNNLVFLQLFSYALTNFCHLLNELLFRRNSWK